MLKSLKTPGQFENTVHQTPVNSVNLNAYTPVEISRLLLYEKRTGKLAKRMQEYRLKSATHATTKRFVK